MVITVNAVVAYFGPFGGAHMGASHIKSSFRT